MRLGQQQKNPINKHEAQFALDIQTTLPIKECKMSKQKQELILGDDDGGLGFLDWQAPDDQIDAEEYPYLQWSNEEKAWEFPLKHWAGTQIDQDHKTDIVLHDSGQSEEPGMLLNIIHIAVIASRTTWEKWEDGQRTFSATYQAGYSKRYNFMVIVREAESNEPAIITMSGYTGGYLESAIRAHRGSILKMASKLAKGVRFPDYMFWLPLTAGEKVFVGKGEKRSAIYPPVTVYNDISQLAQSGIVDIVKALYIGDTLRDQISDFLHPQGQEWAAEHQQGQLPAPQDGPALLLPGGILVLPDLSARSEVQWINMAFEIKGMFNARRHVGNAFLDMLRKKGLEGATKAQQWEGWRDELKARAAEMAQSEEDAAHAEQTELTLNG